jgi:hypothetical protein
MVHSKVVLSFVAFLLASVVTAQEDEEKFAARQADKLNKFAKRAFDKGFPRQARLIWLQTIKLYDPNSEDAHTALGRKRIGNSWNPDPAFTYPTEDTGSGSDGQALFKAYESLSKDLANGHKRQAKAWAKAERTDRVDYHYGMVLRWVPDDKDAQEALEHRDFGGMTGTSLEQTLYENSKKIEAAVQRESKKDYPVEPVENASCPPLERAQVKYTTVQSEHFTLHGDPEQQEALMEALRWSERTLQVCRAVFPWQVNFQRSQGDFAFFLGKDTYKQILKANADQVPDLEWKLEHTSTCGIGNVSLGAVGDERTMLDAAVRNVARRYAGFATAGFNEGIGHTFVGMMFNNNRLFSVDLKKQQGTTASEEDREYTSPDFDVWKTLNLELAWKNTGGVAARDLPFCEAATFTNEQRIKAWSFCDYVMRRDPMLLRRMDQLGVEMKKANMRQPVEFEKRFNEGGDVTVAQLDREWEDFWTEATGVLRAIQNNTPPLAAVSKGVEKWLAAFNEARKERGGSPVKWSTNLSTRCYDHAQYLKNNKDQRGPALEHQELVDLGGTRIGDLFAQMAIVQTGARVGSADKMFDQWMLWPGYRDALLHDFLLTVGIFVEGDILVMNVVTGLGSPQSRTAGYLSHPRKGEQGIPDRVAVEDLGPELEALLAKHGHADKKFVGYPLTLHFGRSIQGNRLTYQCAVEGRDGPVEGLLMFDDGKNRRTSAPGMVTFYPLEPLPRGDVAVRWSWETDQGPRQLTTSFKTK